MVVVFTTSEGNDAVLVKGLKTPAVFLYWYCTLVCAEQLGSLGVGTNLVPSGSKSVSV